MSGGRSACARRSDSPTPEASPSYQARTVAHIERRLERLGYNGATTPKAPDPPLGALA